MLRWPEALQEISLPRRLAHYSFSLTHLIYTALILTTNGRKASLELFIPIQLIQASLIWATMAVFWGYRHSGSPVTTKQESSQGTPALDCNPDTKGMHWADCWQWSATEPLTTSQSHWPACAPTQQNIFSIIKTSKVNLLLCI